MTSRPTVLVRKIPYRPLIRPHAVPVLLACATLMFALLSAAFFDAPAARLFAQTPSAWRAVALLITKLGTSGYMLVAAACVGVTAWWMQRGQVPGSRRAAMRVLTERAVYVFVVVAISGLLAQMMKHLVGRARPKLLETLGAYHFDAFSIKASLASFPSGHTTSVFALAIAMGLLLPRSRTPLLIAAAVVGLSRAVVGSHYLSDVLAGAALGIATALVVARFMADRTFAFEMGPDVVRTKSAGAIWPVLVEPDKERSQRS